ncbi:hypothetical protein LG200_06690 [Methylobacillus caricis]|uniref:hypothetical protein n=1 Tax=Methylobacillus caricis TaxID=1971611 RepID=UPI001D001035|nr:hypothetical protein [Methylobacillus caricis]MCB5187692.1 hypothetical protein [Methylobacillus caricis]
MNILTFTASINAWTLFHACQKLGLELKTTETKQDIAIPIGNIQDEGAWLLFTEEANLRKALDGEIPGSFWPKGYPRELLDDKWEFAEWLVRQPGLMHGPRHVSLDDICSLEYPLFLKAKHSWQGEKKLPRGWLCNSPDEVEYYKDQVLTLGYKLDSFFLQEWLGEADTRLFSVCGFFDANQPKRNITCVVERLAGYTSGPSCSAVVGIMPDEFGLTPQAFAILDRLAFVGPFEMEFIVTDSRIVVLELNPRFWMQHGLFLSSGNALVKRYLELDTADDYFQPEPEKLLWVDGLWMMKSLVRCDFRLFSILWKWRVKSDYAVIVCPPPSVAITALVRKIKNYCLDQLRH